MTMKDVVNLSIPQLEYLLDGCSKNNKDIENGSSEHNTFEGADAIQYLIDSGEVK